MSEDQPRGLGEREQRLLRLLVERFIRDGEPVGSRNLSQAGELRLSAATVRNTLADLERAGYLRAPHTSAGRVPTDRGYRFFVDHLLTGSSVAADGAGTVAPGLEGDVDRASAVGTASSLLSDLTRLAGVVTLPRRRPGTIRQLEFLTLGECRVLAVVVLTDGQVENRVIDTDRDYSPAELQRIGNYLSQEFAGQGLASIRRSLVAGMQADRQSMNELMTSAIDVAERVFGESAASSDDYVMTGETNLMTFTELADIDKLKGLFDAFSQKRDVLHLLDRSMAAEGVQILIGQESGYEVFDGVSLVTASYQADDEVLGVLGVIGPSRMAYEQVIPIVELTAQRLGRALNSPV